MTSLSGPDKPYYFTVFLDGRQTGRGTYVFGVPDANGYSGNTQERPLAVQEGTYDLCLDIVEDTGSDQLHEGWKFWVENGTDFCRPEFYANLKIYVELQESPREMSGELCSQELRKMKDGKIHLGCHALQKRHKLICIEPEHVLLYAKWTGYRKRSEQTYLGKRKFQFWVDVQDQPPNQPPNQPPTRGIAIRDLLNPENG